MKMEICVVTILIGDLPYKKIAKDNHEQYCKKYNYSYVCLEKAINDHHPTWMKPDIILEQLDKGYRYVFWIDGDSFFMNMDIPLESFFIYNKDLIATGDVNDIINAGHFLFKNTEWTKSLIKKWISFRQPLLPDVLEKLRKVTVHITSCDRNYTHNPVSSGNLYLSDQPCLNLIIAGADENNQQEWFDIFNNINFYHGNIYKKHGKEYSPICDENLKRTMSLISDKYKSNIEILSQNKLNSYPDSYRQGDFLIHFIGDKNIINHYYSSLKS